MKVLITGGCGFIGSHVADKFYNEGHEIYIIDNLSTGNHENVRVNHKFYKLNIEDKECDEVFKENMFDIVIHMAAQADVSISITNPYLDTKVNVLGLINMLNLSNKYNVKKFIFASSAAVYGDNQELPLKEEYEINPLSPYGISKYVGELYCKKWHEIYGLDTVCLRFSNVYGPRQSILGEGGVVSIFINRILNNQELIVYGDGNQTRDFIFVEDLAEAIYAAAEKKCSKVLNLSTNTENTLNELINIFTDITVINGIDYCKKRIGDILHSRLDNSKAKVDLCWSPAYTLGEGIKKTYLWYIKNCLLEV